MPLDRDRTVGWGVFLFALLTRILHTVGYIIDSKSELYYWPVLACRQFEEAAVGILQGKPPSGPFVYSSALYRYFILPFYAVGADRTGLFAFQSILGVLTAWLIFRTARLAGAGLPSSVIASVAWCLYAPAAFVEFTILPVSMMALLLTLFSLLQLRGSENKVSSRGSCLLQGLIPGILTGLRPPYLFLFSLPVWGWVKKRDWRSILIASAALAVPLLFLSWQQMESGGGFYPFPRATGLNLVLGHSADATGYGPPILSLGLIEDGRRDIHEVGMQLAAEQGAVTPAEADAYWTGIAMEHIRSEPERELELLGIKYAGFFGIRPFDTYYEFCRTGSFNSLLRLFITPRWLISGLFLLSILPFLFRGRNRLAVLLPVGITLATCLLVVHSERYFLPVLPLILISTVLGMKCLLELFREMFLKGLVFVLVGLFLLLPLLFFPVPLLPESHYIGSLAVRAYNMGNYELSLELFERQAVLAPPGTVSWVRAHEESARIARALGMRDKVVEHEELIEPYISDLNGGLR